MEDSALDRPSKRFGGQYLKDRPSKRLGGQSLKDRPSKRLGGQYLKSRPYPGYDHTHSIPCPYHTHALYTLSAA